MREGETGGGNKEWLPTGTKLLSGHDGMFWNQINVVMVAPLRGLEGVLGLPGAPQDEAVK